MNTAPDGTRDIPRDACRPAPRPVPACGVQARGRRLRAHAPLLVQPRISRHAPDRLADAGAVLEKIIEYEAVHQIVDWDDLRRRLEADRRCFGFFHPSLPDEPLIFVEVALTKGLAGSVTDLLFGEVDADVDADTAIFYSISNCQRGSPASPSATSSSSRSWDSSLRKTRDCADSPLSLRPRASASGSCAKHRRGGCSRDRAATRPPLTESIRRSGRPIRRPENT